MTSFPNAHWDPELTATTQYAHLVDGQVIGPISTDEHEARARHARYADTSRDAVLVARTITLGSWEQR